MTEPKPTEQYDAVGSLPDIMADISATISADRYHIEEIRQHVMAAQRHQAEALRLIAEYEAKLGREPVIEPCRDLMGEEGR